MQQWKTWGWAAFVVVAGTFSIADAAEPRGPAFGSNKVQSAIQDTGGETDVDDYVAALLAGETLSVTVGATKKSPLLPSVQVLDPEGVDRTPDLKQKGGGKKLSFKKLAIDKTGRWTVRIAASTSARGEYAATFKVGKAKPTTIKNATIDAGVATEVTHAFAGIEGARATISVKSAPGSAPLTVVALSDPSGNDVPSGIGAAADDFVAKGTKLSLKNAPLATGDGEYGLTLGIESGVATYTLKVRVKPNGRPKKKSNIPALEPFLSVREAPFSGAEGVAITLTGQNFGTGDDDRPSVFFDGAEGTVTSVAPNGLSLIVLPPRGTEGTTATVAVVDAFGQASQRDDYFFYVPRPTITAIVADGGAPILGGSTSGGHAFRMLGTGFASGQTLRFGSQDAPAPQFVSATEFGVASPPAGGAGDVFLILTDGFGRQVTSPFQYEFKAPAVLSSISAETYAPAAGRELGGTVVNMMGSGFENTDELLFDGQVLASVLLSPTRRRFVSPARSVGTYAVALRDRFGDVFDGPGFRVKAPPRVDSVVAIGGFLLPGNQIGLGGGTILRVTGANFESDDTVAVGGVPGSPSFSSTTRFEFATPETAPGSVGVTVTDILGDASGIDDAFTSAGFDDVTATRAPAGTGLDDFGAVAAAMADLDDDGLADDLVIAGKTGGTRTEETRLLQGDGAGKLIDVTATQMPAAVNDPLGRGFAGTALAIGDIDGQNGPDIIVGDQSYFSGTTYYYYDGVRVLANDGSGGFSFSTTLSPASNYYYYGGYIDATDELDVSQYVGSISAPPVTSSITGIAIGDLDGDGDNDVVTTAPFGCPTYFYVDPTVVDFSGDTYTVTAYDAANTTVSAYYYLSATRILDNDGGLRDRTLQRIGVLGSSTSTAAALNGRDVALGDIDGVNGLDIVVTWDDPLTVSLTGYVSAYVNGSSSDSARVATRVLLNDGNGFFTDDTSSWLPAGSTPEFWQGHAIAVVDIVGDARLDLVIVHDKGPSATSSALRILRNDGAATGFTDVTSSVLPILPPGENLAGSSLLIHDVNGDGNKDILIGTARGVLDSQGAAARSTRILFGNGGGTFAFGPEFIASPATDSGEASFLVIGDLEGHDDPVLILGTETAPQNSTNNEKLRVLDWED